MARRLLSSRSIPGRIGNALKTRVVPTAHRIMGSRRGAGTRPVTPQDDRFFLARLE